MSEQRHLSSGKQALEDWGDVLRDATEPIECGESWTPEKGWQAYMRTGDKLITLSPVAMRKLALAYIKASGRKYPSVSELIDTMRECAKAAEMKNKRRIIPKDAAGILPARGRA